MLPHDRSHRSITSHATTSPISPPCANPDTDAFQFASRTPDGRRTAAHDPWRSCTPLTPEQFRLRDSGLRRFAALRVDHASIRLQSRRWTGPSKLARKGVPQLSARCSVFTYAVLSTESFSPRALHDALTTTSSLSAPTAVTHTRNGALRTWC